MDIQSVYCIYFSPTGTTRTIVEGICQGLSLEQVDMVDITESENRGAPAGPFENQLVILAVPVYYGRVPETVIPYLTKLKADRTPVVPVVVYGNREYEDALLELHKISLGCGFIPVAGGAFVGEHSYSSPKLPIAQGRPDEEDIKNAREFGTAVRKKLNTMNSPDVFPELNIPGNTPHIEPENLKMIRKARAYVALTPETDESKCVRCGQCANVCPTNAISIEDPGQTGKWACIICFACIKSCPEEARRMNEPLFQSAIENLHKTCQKRKSPEIFL